MLNKKTGLIKKKLIAKGNTRKHHEGKKPDINQFKLSNGAIKQLFAILSTFYNYLLQDREGDCLKCNGNTL